jgi:hypothetical protein
MHGVDHLAGVGIHPVRQLELPIRLCPPSLGLDPRLTRLPSLALAQGHGAGHDDYEQQDQQNHQNGAHLWLLTVNRSMVTWAEIALSPGSFTPQCQG